MRFVVKQLDNSAEYMDNTEQSFIFHEPGVHYNSRNVTPIKKNDYDKWSKEELIREIKKLKKRKKYGIVWEDKPEQVAELCKEKLPVLVDDRSKEIITDKEKPVNV